MLHDTMHCWRSWHQVSNSARSYMAVHASWMLQLDVLLPFCTFQRTSWADVCNVRPSLKACSYSFHAVSACKDGMSVQTLISPDRTIPPFRDCETDPSKVFCKSAEQACLVITRDIQGQIHNSP